MRILPQTSRDWFDMLPLVLKACVIFSVLALIAYHQALAAPSEFPATVHREMKTLAQPVQIFCIVASILLFVIGIIETFRRRRRRAIWDFIFGILALFCFSLADLFTVPVK
jgi:hypothetical protein